MVLKSKRKKNNKWILTLIYINNEKDSYVVQKHEIKRKSNF